MFAGLAEMARVRAGQLALRAGDRAELLDTGDDRVLGYVRRHPRGPRLVALAAFSDHPVAVPRHRALPGFVGDAHAVLASPGVRVDDHDRAPARVGLRVAGRDRRGTHPKVTDPVLHRPGRAPGCGVVPPVEVRVVDDLVGRRRAPLG